MSYTTLLVDCPTCGQTMDCQVSGGTMTSDYETVCARELKHRAPWVVAKLHGNTLHCLNGHFFNVRVKLKIKMDPTP